MVILTCNSADDGVAAIVSISVSSNVIKPVAFASKKLNDTQIKYPILEKEAYAIIFGVSSMNFYMGENLSCKLIMRHYQKY